MCSKTTFLCGFIITLWTLKLLPDVYWLHMGYKISFLCSFMITLWTLNCLSPVDRLQLNFLCGFMITLYTLELLSPVDRFQMSRKITFQCGITFGHINVCPMSIDFRCVARSQFHVVLQWHSGQVYFGDKDFILSFFVNWKSLTTYKEKGPLYQKEKSTRLISTINIIVKT